LGKRTEQKYNGILLVDKPIGFSSHDVIQQIRKITSTSKVGHTGTLDPLAEGLLVLCLGRSTKIAQFITGYDKTYRAVITLGKESKTYDSEGIDENSQGNQIPDIDKIELDSLLNKFRGKITQTVPHFSAVHVNGKRLYESARNNENIELPQREVTINELKFIDYSKPELSLEISCSKGTYIRSIAHDIGQTLGCGAYLSKLKRTQVADFRLENALTIDEISNLEENNSLENKLLNFQQVLSYSSIIVSDDIKKKVFQGQKLVSSGIIGFEGDFELGDKVILKIQSGEVLAIGESLLDSHDWNNNVNNDDFFRYIRVLN